MKIKNFVIIAILGFVGMSCGSEGGTKFNPKEKEVSMTDSERQAAIAAKKESLNVSINSMMNSNGVKLTVLPPSPSGDITEAVSEQIGAKMLEMIAANGIGGVNNTPDFALAATMSDSGRETTGSALQKFIVKYDVTYQVLNMLDGTVFASASTQISGVGNSFQEATRNAVNEIKSTDEIQKMLNTGSERIIDWFNTNLPGLKKQVATAVETKDFPLALAYLNSVPSQASEAYTYASAEQPKVLEAYKKYNASSNFAAMKKAIAAGQQATDLNPEVYTYLALIPEGTPEYAQAQKIVDDYQVSVLKRKAEAEDRQFKADEAQKEREQAMAMAQLQADKEIAIAEAKATEQAIKQHMKEQADSKRGFWGNLGARIISGMDYMGDQISGNKNN